MTLPELSYFENVCPYLSGVLAEPEVDVPLELLGLGVAAGLEDDVGVALVELAVVTGGGGDGGEVLKRNVAVSSWQGGIQPQVIIQITFFMK